MYTIYVLQGHFNRDRVYGDCLEDRLCISSGQALHFFVTIMAALLHCGFLGIQEAFRRYGILWKLLSLWREHQSHLVSFELICNSEGPTVSKQHTMQLTNNQIGP